MQRLHPGIPHRMVQFGRIGNTKAIMNLPCFADSSHGRVEGAFRFQGPGCRLLQQPAQGRGERERLSDGRAVEAIIAISFGQNHPQV